MKRALCASAIVAVLCGTASAEAARFDFLGEVRTSTFVGVANAGQYGSGDDSGSCGADSGWDIGGETSATVAFLAHSKRFRHQLALSLGYSAQLCTPILRRPSFGFDYRGEHALSSRTRITGQARAGIDVFDRTLDVRSGQSGQSDPNLPPGSQSASGQFFITTSASVELQHTISDRSAIRTGLSWRALEILGSLDSLPIFSTLGPMQSLEASFAIGRTWSRHRVELPVRYRLSALYASTLRDVLSRSEVKPAHDGFVGGAWEYKLDQRFTVRAETGLGIAAQPHLCVRLDPQLIAGDRCSIDGRVHGIRGNLSPPPLESAIGQVSTLTVAGEVSIGYVGPRRRVDLRLARGYEPDPYAGALTLWDRLGGDYLYRPLWELALYGSLQLMHGSQTSPARVSPPADGPILQVVSPQNRTIYMLLSNFGVGWSFFGPISAFAEGNLFAMAIRGEPVPEYPAIGKEFPTEVARFPFDPSLSTQNSMRFVLYLGLRAQLDTMQQSRREIELLREARSLP